MEKHRKKIICVFIILLVIGIIITAVGDKINNDDVLASGMMITTFSIVALFVLRKKNLKKYCVHCGAKLRNRFDVCEKCGCVLDEEKFLSKQELCEPVKTKNKVKEKRYIQRRPQLTTKYHQGRIEAFEYQMKLGKQLNQDYMECTSIINPCPKCAPLRYRYYSISGKDKRFPKFSDYIKNPEEYCCLNYYTKDYFPNEKITVYQFPTANTVKEKEVNIIKYSNRPFVNDVSENEIIYSRKN